MKNRKSSQLFFIYLPIAFIFLMLLLYFFKFNGKLSDLSDDWGNFGAYFGSITGLLAFLGVIYTQFKSEERFEKLNVLNTKREDRDLYFKLTTIHNENLSNLTYLNIPKDDASGRDSISMYFGEFNKLLLINSIIEVTKHVTYENWLKYIECDNERENSDMIYLDTISKIYHLIDKEYNGDWRTIDKTRFSNYNKYNSEFLEQVKITQDYSIFSITIFEKFNVELTKCIAKHLLTRTLQFFCEKYGKIFDKYINGIYYIVDTCANFHEDHKDFYNRHFCSQLSRVEAIFVFLYSFHNRNSINNLINSGILSLIEINDIYLFKNFQKEIGNEYIMWILKDENI